MDDEDVGICKSVRGQESVASMLFLMDILERSIFNKPLLYFPCANVHLFRMVIYQSKIPLEKQSL